MSGELFAFCTTLCWSLGIFPFTEAARRMGASSVNHIRLLFALFFLTLISTLFFQISFTELFSIPIQNQWIWLGASGIIGLSLGDYFGFTSFSILGARMGSLFGTLAPGAALITGYFFIGETLNIIGITGIIITVLGIVWITLGKNKETSVSLNHGSLSKGIIFGVIAAACQGVGLVLARKGLEIKINGDALNPVHATWIRMTTGTVFIFIFSFITGRLQLLMRPALKNENNAIPFALAGTIFGPVAGVSFSMYAVSLINASVAQTIFSLVPVFALPLSYVFYKEKITLQAFTGAAIAVTGVILLIWRERLISFF